MQALKFTQKSTEFVFENFPYPNLEQSLVAASRIKPDLLAILRNNLISITKFFKNPQSLAGFQALGNFSHGVCLIGSDHGPDLSKLYQGLVSSIYPETDPRVKDPACSILIPACIKRPESPERFSPGFLCSPEINTQSFCPLDSLLPYRFNAGGYQLKVTAGNFLQFHPESSAGSDIDWGKVPAKGACLKDPENLQGELWSDPKSFFMRLISTGTKKNICLDCPVAQKCNYNVVSRIPALAS